MQPMYTIITLWLAFDVIYVYTQYEVLSFIDSKSPWLSMYNYDNN